MKGHGTAAGSAPPPTGSGITGKGRWKNPILRGALAVLGIQLILTALVFLPTPHTGGDNAAYITLAHSLLEGGAYVELWDPQEPMHTKYPPVFPLLLAATMALGVKGWVGLKAVPFLSTLLAGLATFLWVRGRAGVMMGVGVALILAFSDGVLYYSRWILSDPLFLALTLGALWALEKGEEGVGDGGGNDAAAGHSADGEIPAGKDRGAEKDMPGEKDRPSYRWSWLGLGFALVTLAYFTRSAGLPLVAATLLWLGMRRWWRPMMAYAVVFVLPALFWWLRGRQVGGGDYMSEFWLLDPYQPELGRAGPGDLAFRIWDNLVSYTTNLIPEGIVGGQGPLLPVLGLALVGLAVLGWARGLIRRPRVAELFFPLYAGLMFLWPQVWSGDRFALPLIPLLLFYAGSGLLFLLAGIRPFARNLVLGSAFLILVLPAGRNWMAEVQAAGTCRRLAARGDPWACHPVNVREYVLMASWAGENLPEGAAVVTRKPRIFFVLSGVKTLSLPLTTDADTFLSRAEAKGARYLTVDRWDGLAAYYLPRILEARPQAFCTITGVEVGGETGIQLLGISGNPEAIGEAEPAVRACPREMVAPEPRGRRSVPSGAVPLLVRNSGG